MTGWRTALIGRDRERAELGEALDDAFAGTGRLCVLVGEPGIGKTRLAEEVAALAVGRGATVAWGRCWEGSSLPSYWPWIQLLRDIAVEWPSVGDVPDSEGRFQLFDGVVRSLRAASEERPLVLLVDDLHAADVPSHLLLDFVARFLPDLRVLVLATTHVARDLPPRAHLIRVTGLAPAETGALLEAVAGTAVTAADRAEVHDTAGGNPFFVRELGRLLAERPGGRPAPLAVPDSIREVVRHRLAPLSAEALAMLELAAVAGREFDATLIAAGAEDLAEAEDGGVISRGPALDHYWFAHPILRETIYADLSPAIRSRLHLQIAMALASREHGDAHVAALAHHFVAAAPLADPDQVLTYVLRAGRHAMAAHAYEDAVSHLQVARDLLAAQHPTDESAACRLLLELGHAQSAAGDKEAASATYDGAVELARRVGSDEQFALAVLGRAGDIPPAGTVDPRMVHLLEEAARAVATAHPALGARVSARLAVELYFTNELERRDTLSAAALAQAERSGDPGAVAAALSARHYALFGPHDLDGRLATATALLKLATESGDVERMLQAHWWRVSDLLEKGDIIEVDRELATWTRLAAELRQPQYEWAPAMVRATRANLAGRIDQCEELAYEAQAIGQAAVPDSAMAYFSAHFFSVRRWQCRLTELEPSIEALVESMPQVPLWRCALAYIFSETGRDVEARRELDFFADRDFVDIPRDAGWLMSISLLADVCGWLGDVLRARVLHGLMAPYADRFIVAGFGGVSHASASRCLGVLAATAGEFAVAETHFESALTANRRAGAAAWLAHTRIDYGEMLLARDAEGDRLRAVELLEDARVELRQLGLDAFAERVTARLDEIELPVARPAALEVPIAAGESAPMADVIRLSRAGRRAKGTAGPVPAAGPAPAGGREAQFRRQGDYWTFSFGGPEFRLRDAKGFHYIADLLRRPSAEIAALDFGGTAEGAVVQADTGDVLDATARAAYRSRLADLEREREEAEAFNDPERASRATAEIDFIARELAAAVGLGGRPRQGPSSGERARVRVTKAIKASIKKLGEHDASLGFHLGSAIHTGYVCSYRPNPDEPVAWQL